MKNEPAFPQSDPIANEFHKKFGTDRGMTLRDYFAAKAMQSLLVTINGVVGTNVYEHRLSKEAYKLADAMLKARQE
jgi:hypothetical protein